MSQCSICLSKHKDPVCIPCGHVYCKICLKGVANGSRNTGLTAKCPDCRAEFHLTVPDLTYLPEKYHTFVSHPLRRVYIDTPSSPSSSPKSALENALKAAEARLASKEATEEQLLRRCEELTVVLDAHRQGEREANERIMDMEEEMEEIQSLLKKKDEKMKDLEEKNYFLTEAIKYHEKGNSMLKAENTQLSMRIHELDSKPTEADRPDKSGADVSSKQVIWLAKSGSENTAPLPLAPLKSKQPHSSSNTNLKADADHNDVPAPLSPRSFKPLPRRPVTAKPGRTAISRGRPREPSMAIDKTKIF